MANKKTYIVQQTAKQLRLLYNFSIIKKRKILVLNTTFLHVGLFFTKQKLPKSVDEAEKNKYLSFCVYILQ